MGVYIPKLKLPSVDSRGYHIEIDASGLVKVYAFNRAGEFWREELVTNAVEVKTPHGRLIDADALKKVIANAKHMDASIYDGKTMYSDHLCVGADYDDVCAAIDETTTIIEAEG